ncbi:MAG TPA: serine hydrolase [Gemmatimonadaceae bacterium]|nr:serine hydrolase [Gemmatimonadaceae bacterium]
MTSALEVLRRPLLVGAAAVLASAGTAGAARGQKPAAADLRSFDAYAAKAMKDWKVPGMAIAIVRNDSVVFAKGYGVRKVGDPTPVDPHTVFAIGSSTKAFTSATVAMLVDDGKMKWDAPLTTYLPGFQMYDPYAARELTVRDALSHRSGLARGDFMWYAADYSRDEVLRRVRYLEPSWSFRSNFGYQNIMYLAAGQAAAAATGRDWDTLIRERIFAPLGMRESSTSVRALASLPNVAQPYAEIDGAVTLVPYANIDNIGPAGSINSTVLDMAQWLRLQLGDGKYAGKQLVSSANLAETHTAQTVMKYELPWSLYFPEAHLMSYGMGWFLNDYKGHIVVHHGGNIDGMSALVAMLPDEKIGAVILTNMTGSLLPFVMAHRIFDDQLKLPPTDFSGRMRLRIDSLEALERAAAAKGNAARVPDTHPTLALDKYAGTYTDSLYGDMVVRFDGGKLLLSYGGESEAELEHWHYDTFRVVWKNRLLGKPMVTFVVDGTPKVASMNLENIGEFVRVPAKGDTTSSARQ